MGVTLTPRNSAVVVTGGAWVGRMNVWASLARTWRGFRRIAPLHRAALLTLAHLPRVQQWVGRARRRLHEDPNYADWIRRYDSLSASDVAAIRTHIANLPTRLLSVVMPVYNTDATLLREAIASVLHQLYPHWELCIADDSSSLPHVREVLEEIAHDPRVKVAWRHVNGHISAATNSALALATGEFVALMDHDDVLPPHALYEVAAALQAYPETDVIYTDEDKIDENSRRFAPYCKPDWNPDLLLGQNYVNHLSVFRRSLVEQVGGMREGFEGSQDHDLILRIVELTRPERIHHIPAILYHWRQTATAAAFSDAALQRCIAAARQAVAEHLDRTGITGARVAPHPKGLPWLRIFWPLPREPLVSIIVPTRNHATLLAQVASAILQRTDYANFELVIVDNASDEVNALSLLQRLERDKRVKLLRFPGPFNYSAINNYAVAESAGDVIVLLNNYVDVAQADWLREMVSLAIRPDVGAVGAKLIYANNTSRHAGFVLGTEGLGEGGHGGIGIARGDIGYFGDNALTRNVSVVSTACLAIRREVYLSVGGLDDKNLTIAFNDIDLCLRIAEIGLRNVWTPFAELYHLGSASPRTDIIPSAVVLDSHRCPLPVMPGPVPGISSGSVPRQMAGTGPGMTGEAGIGKGSAVRAAGITPAGTEQFAREFEHLHARWGAALDDDPFYSPNFSLANANHDLAEPRRVRPWQHYLSPGHPSPPGTSETTGRARNANLSS